VSITQNSITLLTITQNAHKSDVVKQGLSAQATIPTTAGPTAKKPQKQANASFSIFPIVHLSSKKPSSLINKSIASPVSLALLARLAVALLQNINR